MAIELNEVHFIGNLGADAEVNEINETTKVVNFSVAVTRRYRKSGEDELTEETTWYRCAGWNGHTRVAPYLLKGKQVRVRGRLRPEIRVFDRNDGTQGASYEVTVEDIQLLGGNGNGGSPKVEADEVPF